jgi:predicted transcriptional regulator
MGNHGINNNTPDSDPAITLNLLTAVEEDSALTQRSVAKDLGIALGLANSYLKHCVKKGFIKVQQVPANRYAYYLTPKGFSEKSQLTVQYLSMSFDFFRHARLQCTDVLSHCTDQGWKRVGLVGVSDLSEITILCAHNLALELAGIVDPANHNDAFLDLPVVHRPKDLGPLDALVITDLTSPQATFELTIKAFPQDRVLAPKMLNISCNGEPGT